LPEVVFELGWTKNCQLFKDGKYRILALTGSRIQDGVLEVNHALIHIASIPSGIYLLELIDSYGIKSMLKFVKE
jgi:hypothetical protein